MPIFKCKMCGGDVVLAEDKTFGTCEYCGSSMTFPKVTDEQRAAAFNRGNAFRRMGEFDKALAVYERIVAEDDNDAEAHWCCALCRFGIEWVEDPNTFEYVPTCHRASFDSFLEDVDYLAAVEHSDGVTRRQYQRDGARINEVQRGILATSQHEKPFDVFICYKELDDGTGERTRDSIDAQEIYYNLTQEGYRVFFSRITLEDKVGTEYEPYIFAALNSAKVMVVLGSKPEYFNAVWVKNEWSRYLTLMHKDRSKLLLPCYKNMDPYDLPDQLSVLMSYDMGRIGFIQDLIRGVDKVLSAEKPKESAAPAAAPVQERVIVQQSGGGPNVTALLKRGQQALEDGEWEKATGFFDQVLSMDAENAEAFIGLALAGQHSRDLKAYADSLCAGSARIETETLARDKAHIERSIAKSIVPGYCDGKELIKLYDFEEEYTVELRGETAFAQQVKSRFNGERNLSRAFRYAQGETKQKLEALKKELFDKLDKRVRDAQASDQEAIEKAKAEYAAKLEAADRKAEELSHEAQDKRERDYQTACRLFEEAIMPHQFRNVANNFGALKGYKDSTDKKQEALVQAEALEKAEKETAAEEAERQRIAREKTDAARKKKNIIIASALGGLAVLALAVFLLMTKVVIPAGKYRQAAALEAQGELVKAVMLYNGLGDFKDCKQKTAELWGQITQRETISVGGYHTVGLRSDGTVVAVGDNEYGKCDVSGWKDIIAVAAGYSNTVGLRADGTVVAVGKNTDGRCDVSDWTDIKLPEN